MLVVVDWLVYPRGSTTQCPQPADLMLDILILINPHMRTPACRKPSATAGPKRR
jgi:hypothetical protein